jgi:AcrR family transcriptional regulator
VDAILDATIQVLLAVGKERLTTTRVAARAGVSVGTLYQYFPNKAALLQAALRRHLNGVAEIVEHTCREQHGQTHRQMVTALVSAYLEAKMRNPTTSVALYSVGSDVDGATIAQEMGTRLNRAVVRMLTSSSDPLAADPELVATMLQGAMVGVIRSWLESGGPGERCEAVRRELVTLGCAYLSAAGVVARDAAV